MSSAAHLSVKEKKLDTPSVHLTRFITYISSSPAERGDVVASLRTEFHWTPAKDYWHSMRNAIRRDRSGSRDGSEALALVPSAPPHKSANYRAAAESWCDVISRWENCVRHPVKPSRANIGGLDVTVRPTFVEVHRSGEVEAVMIKLTKSPLTPVARHATLAVASRAYPDTTVTIVDLQNRGLWTGPEPSMPRYQPWLVGEAAGLAHLLNSTL